MRRARAAAQLLDGRRPGGHAGSPAEVVSAVVGVQAQDRQAAALAIRARSKGLVAADVDAATADGALVLTWSLRGTRHLHHRADVRWLTGLLGPLFGRPGRRAEQLGIAGPVGARAVEVLADALAHGSLSRPEVKDLLAPLGVDPSGQAPIHVIRRAALEGRVCVVPGPGGQERYALLDDRVAAAEAVDKDAAAPELARRYLAAHGPASPADFAAWSGMSASLARTAWAAIVDQLVEVEGPAGDLWLTAEASGPAATAAGEAAPLRLLGAFDGLLLGYADRSLLVPPAHARSVNAGGGMVKPVVLADGRVVATWRWRRGRGAPLVEIEPFDGLTPDEWAEAVAEVADVGRFTGTSPVLAVGGP